MTRSPWRVEHEGLLRTFLAERSQLSVRHVKRLLDKNQCQVNGAFERFGTRRLKRGDLVELEVGEAAQREVEVLYEDDHLVVCNKPAGRVSAGEIGVLCPVTSCHLGEQILCGSEGWRPKTTMSGWRGRSQSSRGKDVATSETKLRERVLVHRLDKDTSGVLILAKTEGAARHLEDQFRERSVKKSYLAVVVGRPNADSGEIESELAIKGRYAGQSMWGSVSGGKWAKTVWEVVEEGKGETLVRCTPLTGRTHQLRVHLAEMGHPVVGDGQYGKGGRMPGRHLLHAEKITITHPEKGEMMTFTAPRPSEMKCTS